MAKSAPCFVQLSFLVSVMIYCDPSNNVSLVSPPDFVPLKNACGGSRSECPMPEHRVNDYLELFR